MAFATPDFEMQDPLPPLRWPGKIVAAVWAFADATVFFIVPDIWLTYVGLKHGTFAALLAGLFVTLGGVIGGLALFFFASSEPAEARNILLMLPAVNAEALQDARALLARWDAIAVVGNPYSLMPFKVLAVEAPAAKVQPLLFGLATFFAYLSRAFLIALIAGFLGWLFRRTFGVRRLVIWAMLFWAVMYALFFVRFYI